MSRYQVWTFFWRSCRFARRCERCERAAEYGREVLQEFGSHVDSTFGQFYVLKKFKDEERGGEEITLAAIAATILMK